MHSPAFIPICARACRMLIVVALLLCAAAPVAGGQATGAVREAERLRNDGNLTAAVDLLRAQLQRQPDDGEAARLLAQTLYWLHDFEGARRAYDAALERHPEDTTLRLQFGRMLLETGSHDEARALITPLRQGPATRAEADALLGTLAYWQGDLTLAKQLFLEALQDSPNHAEARRQLGEIAAASAAWIRLLSAIRHDDQPLDRLGVGAEAGWFATPLIPVKIRTEPVGFRLADGRVSRLWLSEAEVRGYVPLSRLEFELGGGALRRSGDAAVSTWTGRAGLGVRVTPTVVVRARLERRPYLNTAASITTPISQRLARGAVSWTDPRGWLAEAALEAQYFPDDNRVTSASAWILAPIVHRRRGDLQAGYAWGRADADESRFVLANTSQPVPPSDPRFDLSGRYVPYYTPDNQTTHSIAVAGSAHGASGVGVRVNVAYALKATDQAPLLTVVNGGIERITYERSYSPWSAQAFLAIPLRARLTLGLGAEAGRSAFYRWAGGDVQLTYTFAGLDAERAVRK